MVGMFCGGFDKAGKSGKEFSSESFAELELGPERPRGGSVARPAGGSIAGDVLRPVGMLFGAGDRDGGGVGINRLLDSVCGESAEERESELEPDNGRYWRGGGSARAPLRF